MKRSTALSWALVLLAAAACNSTPTPAPTPLPILTTQPTAVQGTAVVATAPSVTSPAATSDASATDANITPGSVRTVAAGEVVKWSGDTFATSDVYRFSADTTLDITWNYTGTAPFALWLVNASDVVTDPNFDRILVDDVTGPHAGSAKTKIIAGDWTVQVEQAEGPWTVDFQPES